MTNKTLLEQLNDDLAEVSTSATASLVEISNTYSGRGRRRGHGKPVHHVHGRPGIWGRRWRRRWGMKRGRHHGFGRHGWHNDQPSEERREKREAMKAEWRKRHGHRHGERSKRREEFIRRRAQATGAGVIWSADGLILTNAHVVQQKQPMVTLADGRQFEAEIVKYDADTDLALLKIPATDLTPIKRGSSKSLRAGDVVMSVGHPWGVKGAASAGSVIAVGQPNERIGRYRGDLVQVSLTLRPGHSGGPMVNSAGEIIGVNTMISGPKVGLAVPIHVVEAFAADAASDEGDYV